MSDDFYVNYLPPPPSVRRFAWAAGIGIVAMMLAGAAVLAALQRSPGNGRWEVDQPRVFTGVLTAQPYPALVTTDGVYLLVTEGKHGAAEIVKEHSGHSVELRGDLIEREGRRLIEVLDEPDAVRATSTAPAPVPPPVALSATLQLVGEVIDPKCYMGVMKPGEGKPHKACAALCLSGGVPPMFVALVNGQKQFWLLVSADGGPVTGDELQTLIRFVGDKVTIDGLTGHWAGGDALHVRSVARSQP